MACLILGYYTHARTRAHLLPHDPCPTLIAMWHFCMAGAWRTPGVMDAAIALHISTSSRVVAAGQRSY